MTGGIPAMLLPGREYTIPISAHITRNVRPEGGTKLLLSGGLSILYTFRSQEAVETLSLYSREYAVAGSVAARLNNNNQPDEISNTAVATFTPPFLTKGREEYAVQVNMHNHLHYTCIYKWQPGTPTDEEQQSLVPDEYKERPVWPRNAMAATIRMRGQVEVKRAGLNVWDTVKGNIYLMPGDVVRTGDNSVLEFAYSDGSMVRLPRNSSILLEKPSDKVDTIEKWQEKHGYGIITMIVGKLWIRAVHGTDLTVKTSNAIAGVRGTTYSVGVRENGSEYFNCYTGEIVVKAHENDRAPQSKAREVVVKAGQTTGFSPRGHLLGVENLSDEALSVGWILGRPDFLQAEVPAEEQQGKLAADRERNEWRLQVYEQPGRKHGILYYDGMPIGDVAQEKLTSPFGGLRYHGPFEKHGKGDSGWLLVEDDAAPQPATQAQPPADAEILPDPGNLRHFRQKVGETFHFRVEGRRTNRAVWGTDIYTDDSDVGTAAVHAGILKPGQIGVVTVTILPGQDSYAASERHGVKSRVYGRWSASYRFLVAD